MLHRPLSVSLIETVHTAKLLPKRRPSTIEHQTWQALGSKEVPNIWVALQSTVLRALKALIRFSSPVNKSIPSVRRTWRGYLLPNLVVEYGARFPSEKPILCSNNAKPEVLGLDLQW